MYSEQPRVVAAEGTHTVGVVAKSLKAGGVQIVKVLDLKLGVDMLDIRTKDEVL